MTENNNRVEAAMQKVGYATVPPQIAKTIFYYSKALSTGTLFPCLNYPKGEYGPREGFYISSK